MTTRYLHRAATAWSCAAMLATLAACGPSDPGRGGTAHEATANQRSGGEQDAVISNRIPIPPKVRSNLGITFVAVERRAIADTVRLPGRCEIEASGRSRYRAVFSGRLEILVEPYETVKVGHPLFSIKSPDWRELQGTLEALAAAAETTRAAEVSARARREEAKSALEAASAQREKHTARVKAGAEHVAALARSATTWETEIERLERLASQGGGVAGKLATARARLTDIRVEEAKAAEEATELGQRRLALDAALRRARLAGPSCEAEARARAIEAKAAQKRFRFALERAASRLGVKPDTLTATNDAGVVAWRSLDRVLIRALEPGRVERFHWANGDWAEADAVVISTVDEQKIAFHADVLQSDLEALAKVTEGRIVPAGGDGDPVPCTVRLGVSGNAARRTFPAHAEPTGRAPWLRPGVAAFLELVRAGGRPELAVPLKCVVADAGKRVLFKRDPKDADKVIRLEVEAGVDDGAWIVIHGALMPGEQVVLEGAYELNLTGKGKAPAGGHFHADGTWHAGPDDH